MSWVFMFLLFFSLFHGVLNCQSDFFIHLKKCPALIFKKYLFLKINMVKNLHLFEVISSYFIKTYVQILPFILIPSFH